MDTAEPACRDLCDDPQRLAALRRYAILDTPREEAFDDLTRLAADICQVPVAAIIFVDADRQWCKSEIGVGVSETPLRLSICANVLHESDLLLIEDLAADDRFKSHAAVVEAGLRSYAGVILTTPDGHSLGTLCVADRQPRILSESQKNAMRSLARQVMTQLELRRALAEQRQAEAAHREAADRLGLALAAANLGDWMWEARTDLMTLSRRAAEIYGVPAGRGRFTRSAMRELIEPQWREAARLAAERAAADRTEYDIEYRIRRADGRQLWVAAKGRGIYDGDGVITHMLGVVQDITLRKEHETARRASEARAHLAAEVAEAAEAQDDPDAVMAAVVGVIGRRLGVSRCAYADVEADGDRFTVHADYCADGVRSLVGQHHLSEYNSIIAQNQRAGRTTVVRDAQAEFKGSNAAVMNALGVRASICCPLVRNGRLRAMMAVHQNTPRDWTEEEAKLVEMLADRCWGHIERARAARELAQSEARFRQLADAMPQIVFAARSDGHVDYFNRKWYEYTGLPDGTVGFENWRQIHTEEGLSRVMEVWPEALRTGQPYEIEYRLRRHDGEYRWHLGRALPVRDAFGAIVRWFGTNTDIHDQKLAQQSLREETQVVETINHVGRTVAAELDLHKVVQTITDAATTLTGASFGAFFYNVLDEKGEWYTLYSLSGVDPAHFASFPMPRNTEIFAPTFSGEGIMRLDDVTQDPRYGKNPPYAGMPPGHLAVRSHLAVPVVSRSGGVIGGLFFGHPDVGVFSERAERAAASIAAQAAVAIDNARLFDAAQRLNAEKDQLLARERAARDEVERVGRVKDEFLATLSHELRTPLNAILGWSQVLRAGAPDADELRQGLEVIERNARAQTQIIEDLLDMSRIISGKLRLDVQPVDLSSVVEAAIETLRPASDAKGVRLQTVIDPSAEPVFGDRGRLQQIFWNLLSNAIKFTPRGGRVQVVLERVDSHVEIRVVDSGEGIDPAFLPYVFDRFRQQDSTSTRKHGGLGLGLAIVKQLVELHGGSVRVASGGPGRGATFTIMLPLMAVHSEAVPAPRPADVAAPAAPVATTMRFDLGGIHALVVDDEADARMLIRRLLEDRGATVTAASSAQEAFERLKERRPDILVSDIGMPGEDGLSLLRRIRALPAEQGGGTPAIALTAYARAEDRMNAVLAGFQSHMAKPAETKELLAAVASLVGRLGR